MPDAKPFSKETQLGAGRPKRYRRKVASPKQWAAIRAEKLDDQPCRVCGRSDTPRGLHHIVPRDMHGDDVADNLAPLCTISDDMCHDYVEKRSPWHLAELAESLTDAEYAYVVGKLGEGALTRLFGVMEPPL